ncbi:hypothetical protein [Gordonia paraffinivorans]|uniref:hypothetical protein n=1 Tax=Gordonia paraffinivorans TaxID=175628 RepID=UPI0014457B3F|nr:hypothetical protein [Gordonia paraffinivorans]
MPPLEQRRFSVSARSYDEAQRLADAPHGVRFDVSEVAELQYVAGRPAVPGPVGGFAAREQHRAAALMNAIASGDAVSPAELEAALPRANVTALRMGPIRLVSDCELTAEQSEIFAADEPSPYPPETHGYPRTRIGMSLADDPATLWSASRGIWRMSPDTEYLVPTRFGFAPYVFKTTKWHERSETVWAAEGFLIDHRRGLLMRLVDGTAETDWRPTLVDGPEATADDLLVARLVTGKVIGFGRRGPNPIIRLRSRTRRIHVK